MKKIKFFSFIFILLYLNILLFANDNLQLYLYIQSLESAGPPQLLGELIILTYQEKRPVYYVGARFDHEQYKVLHKYMINSHDIFVLVIPWPLEETKIKYRIVVDGLWMDDPFNSQYEADPTGVRHSLIYIPPSEREIFVSPEIMEQGRAKFIYQGNSGEDVFIAGDFNNWDPFLNRLVEKSPGVYIITLKLYAGQHYYYFVVNSVHLPDPNNKEIMYDADGFPVSTFIIPGR